MKKIISFTLLLCVTHYSYSQYDTNSLGYGLYDQDNKQKDAESSYTGDNNKMGKGYLWTEYNGSSTNGPRDNKDHIWNTDMFDVSRFRKNNNYNIQNSSTRTTSRSSSRGDIHRQNNDKKREYNARNDALRAQRAEELREQMEENRRREEERKRRIEEENRRDRERGLQEYYMRTAGYHQANAMRDEWMRTEGVRRLKEDYRAIDMADIPEQVASPSSQQKMDVMSGKDMANLLRGKKTSEGEITIEFVEDSRRKDKHDVAITNESHFVELYDDGGYNQSAADQWEQAINSDQAIIGRASTKDISNKYKRTVLITKDELDLSGVYITILPSHGCVGLVNEKIILLESKSLSPISLKNNDSVEQIATCGNKIYGKQTFSVLDITDEKTSELLNLETDDFTIYSESNKTFIICAKFFGISIITRINTESMKYDELLRLKTPIEGITANEKNLLVLSDNNIIQFKFREFLTRHFTLI